MTTKTYAARDSATSALRKLGVQARDYNFFIKKIDGKFECNLGAAAAHLESLKNPKPVEPKVKTDKTTQKRGGISATARALILDGKTNEEVWEVLKQQFNLGHSKRHYPSWYRCEMKRTGLLPKDA